jgi:hypothetical protein
MAQKPKVRKWIYFTHCAVSRIYTKELKNLNQVVWGLLKMPY